MRWQAKKKGSSKKIVTAKLDLLSLFQREEKESISKV